MFYTLVCRDKEYITLNNQTLCFVKSAYKNKFSVASLPPTEAVTRTFERSRQRSKMEKTFKQIEKEMAEKKNIDTDVTDQPDFPMTNLWSIFENKETKIDVTNKMNMTTADTTIKKTHRILYL